MPTETQDKNEGDRRFGTACEDGCSAIDALAQDEGPLAGPDPTGRQQG